MMWHRQGHVEICAFIRAMRFCPDEFAPSRGMDMTVTVSGVDPMSVFMEIGASCEDDGSAVANVFWSFDARALSGTGVGVVCRSLFA